MAVFLHIEVLAAVALTAGGVSTLEDHPDQFGEMEVDARVEDADRDSRAF
jgi:hypothetical protein